MGSRGPVMRMASPPPQGIRCCCCTCCSCIDLGYLKTNHGLMKILEMLLGSLCQSMLVQYGLPQANSIGAAFHGFLTTVSACVLTTTLLIICYVISPKSQNLVRQSLFVTGVVLQEFIFNAAACFLYLSASSCLAAAVNIFLYASYMIQPMFSAYPAMTAVYYIGAVVGVIHGIDAYSAYRYFKGYR